jgi:hypothetical protein
LPQEKPALEAATVHFEVGKRLLREGRRDKNAPKVEGAYDEFKAAYALYQGKGTLLNLVESELATGRNVDAMKHLREYQRRYGLPDEKSEYGKTFKEQWELAFRTTAHIVVVGPPALHIVMDGKDDGELTPLAEPIDVMPGHHAVDGVGTERLHAEVDALSGTTVRSALESTWGSGTPPIAVVPSPSEPNPAPRPTLPHADGVPPVTAHFWTPARIWGLVAGGAGVVSIGVGAAFAVQANHDADQAASLAARLGPSGCVGAKAQACRDLQSAHDDQSRDHALNLAFVGIGAAVAVSGAAVFLWPSHSRSAVAVVPMMSPRSVGVAIRGEL